MRRTLREFSSGSMLGLVEAMAEFLSLIKGQPRNSERHEQNFLPFHREAVLQGHLFHLARISVFLASFIFHPSLHVRLRALAFLPW
jgi:hypothetical protein